MVPVGVAVRPQSESKPTQVPTTPELLSVREAFVVARHLRGLNNGSTDFHAPLSMSCVHEGKPFRIARVRQAMPRRVHFDDVGLKIIDASLDVQTREMLNTMLGEAWGDVKPERSSPLDALAIQATLAIHLIDAARNGERDPTRLRSLASQDFALKRTRAIALRRALMS